MTPAADTPLVSRNPATEALVGEYPVMGVGEVDAVLASAQTAQPGWASRSIADRGHCLRQLASVLRERHVDLEHVITEEMGKPLAESAAEVEKCAVAAEYFADHAAQFLRPEEVASDARHSEVIFQPLGTILASMPWNFPLWQVVRCAAPALAVGNAVVLKHANAVTGCALALAAAVHAAGVPREAFAVLRIGIGQVAGVITDPRIAAVSLTGSTAAGRAVAAAAGAALKPCVLELGGSDPFIVLDDADVAAAARTAVRSRFQNTGQSCIAAKRLIVVEGVADAFEEALIAGVDELRVGDPTEPGITQGPLARDDLRAALERQIEASRRQGGRVVRGGKRPDRPGFYLTPCVMLDCPPGSPAFVEETFGPLAPVVRVRDEAEAVALANASEYGLGAAVWTIDPERGQRVAGAIESGGVFVNGMTHSDARLPFGGIKSSGFGRELHRFGMLEFVNVKTVWAG